MTIKQEWKVNRIYSKLNHRKLQPIPEPWKTLSYASYISWVCCIRWILNSACQMRLLKAQAFSLLRFYLRITDFYYFHSCCLTVVHMKVNGRCNGVPAQLQLGSCVTCRHLLAMQQRLQNGCREPRPSGPSAAVKKQQQSQLDLSFMGTTNTPSEISFIRSYHVIYNTRKIFFQNIVYITCFLSIYVVFAYHLASCYLNRLLQQKREGA